MIEDPYIDDELGFDSWEEESPGPEPASGWRRPILIAVAVITVASLALVPLYNVVFTNRVADNGLRICGFDYCVVQEAVTLAGLDPIMARLANTLLDDEEVVRLVVAATDHLDIASVTVLVRDDLEGRLGGVYDPSTRTLSIERPARAWTVLHEVAHVVASGHGEEFQKTLIELASWADGGGWPVQGLSATGS